MENFRPLRADRLLWRPGQRAKAGILPLALTKYNRAARPLQLAAESDGGIAHEGPKLQHNLFLGTLLHLSALKLAKMGSLAIHFSYRLDVLTLPCGSTCGCFHLGESLLCAQSTNIHADIADPLPSTAGYVRSTSRGRNQRLKRIAVGKKLECQHGNLQHCQERSSKHVPLPRELSCPCYIQSGPQRSGTMPFHLSCMMPCGLHNSQAPQASCPIMLPNLLPGCHNWCATSRSKTAMRSAQSIPITTRSG